VAAERVWTSTKKFSDGREFCSILNQAIREDCAAGAPHTALVTRAINLNLTVARAATAAVAFPPMGITWRGGGFMDTADTRAFFKPGKCYRVPNFLASSFDKSITTSFVNRWATFSVMCSIR
jgi:hypothetical protein